MPGWRLWLGIGFGLGSDFQVVRSGEAVTIRGRVPRAKAPALREFVARDLAGAGPFAVAVTFGPRRTLRFRFAGALDGPTRQRVRNVLIELVK
jgi:hypothetical protein